MSNDSQTASINGSRNAEGTSWSFGLSSSDPTGFTGPTSGIDSPLSPPTDKERDVWKQCTWLCDSDDSTGLADKSSAKPDLNPEDAILHSGKLFENQVIDEDPRLHDDVQLEDARYGGPDDSSLPPQATGADEEVTRTLNPMQRYVTEGSQVPEKIRVPQPQAFGSVGVEASQPPTPKQQSEEEHDEVQLEDGQGRVSDCPAIAPQDALEDGEVAQMSSPLVPASSSHGIVSAPSKETETPAEPTSTSKRKRGPGKEQQPGGKRAGGRGKRKHICVQCQYTHEKACVFDKEHGCCTSCLKSKRDRNLCLVLYLNDCECHRRGKARAGEGKSGCPSLPFISDSESKRTTQIRQHFSNPQGPVPTLIINCMRFREDKSTVLVELFETFDGVIFAVESTPFACIDVGVPFQKGVEEYLDKCTMLAINDLLLDDARASTNTGKRLTDMIGWTVTEACRLVDNKWCSNTPLASALKILATAWMSTKQAIIVGEDKLDMKAVEHPNSYISDQVPVTSCVDTQLDNAAQTYMDRLTAQVVIALKEMMGLKANKKGKTSDQKEEGTSKSKETRSCKTYEIFLTMFVLLNTIEVVNRAQWRYMRRHREKLCSVRDGDYARANVESASPKMIERWRISAQCLIVHFWAVLGRMDLSFDNWESKLLQQKNLDDMSRNTIGMIKALFANHTAEFLEIRERNPILFACREPEEFWDSKEEPERLALLVQLLPKNI